MILMATTIPAALRHHLKTVNVADDDVQTIQTKLRERTLANVISYLQIMLLKLNRSSTKSQTVIDKITNHDELLVYSNYLKESASMSVER